MAATVQSALPTEDFGTSPRTFSLGGAVASGNDLIVVIITGADSGGVDATVTDNQSNTYTLVYDTLNLNDEQVLCYRATNITNGPTSVNVQWTGGGSRFVGIGYVEVSGLGAFISGARTRTVFTETVSTTIDTTGNNGAYGVGVVTSAGKDITPSSGFSRTPASGTSFNHVIFDDDMGTGGTKTYGGTWTGQGNENANVIALAFAASGGGGGPIKPYVTLVTNMKCPIASISGTGTVT